VFVTFARVVRPLLLRLAGATPEPLIALPVISGFAYRKKKDRREYVRVSNSVLAFAARFPPAEKPITAKRFLRFFRLIWSIDFVMVIRYNQVENLDSPLNVAIDSYTCTKTSWATSSASSGLCNIPNAVLKTISCQVSTIVLNADSSLFFNRSISNQSLN